MLNWLGSWRAAWGMNWKQLRTLCSKVVKGKEVVILSNGTGVFPFLDFLDYYLSRMGEVILGEARDLSSFTEEFGDNFTISMLSAFENHESLYEAEFLSSLAEVSENEKSPSQFSLTVRVPKNSVAPALSKFPNLKVTCRRFDADCLKECIPIDNPKTLVCMCGSPQFTHGVLQDLKKLGLDSEKILLL